MALASGTEPEDTVQEQGLEAQFLATGKVALGLWSTGHLLLFPCNHPRGTAHPLLTPPPWDLFQVNVRIFTGTGDLGPPISVTEDTHLRPLHSWCSPPF